MAPVDPLLQVRRLVADARVVAVTGVHDGLLGQRQQVVADGGDDRLEAGVAPARRARASLEQGVAAEQDAEVLGVEARAAGRVARRRDGAQRAAGDRWLLPSAARVCVPMRTAGGTPKRPLCGRMRAQFCSLYFSALFLCARKRGVPARFDFLAEASLVDSIRCLCLCSELQM